MESSSVIRRKSFPATNVNHALAFLQIEQLQRIVPLERSRSASYRTAPQWQLPVTCFNDITISLWLIARKYLLRQFVRSNVRVERREQESAATLARVRFRTRG